MCPDIRVYRENKLEEKDVKKKNRESFLLAFPWYLQTMLPSNMRNMTLTHSQADIVIWSLARLLVSREQQCSNACSVRL